MKKKIAYVTNNIAPFRIELLDALSIYFDEIDLCFFNEIDRGVNPEYVKKRPEHVMLNKLPKRNLLSSFKKIKGFDYIIFDGYSGKEKIILILLCQIHKKKYLISIDGIVENGETGIIKKMFKKHLISHAEKVFSTNKKTDAIIRGYCGKVKIVRHNFTTIKKDDLRYIDKLDVNILRKKYELNNDKPIILFVGKFLRTKGVGEFILSAINNPQYEFHMIGGNEEELEKIRLEIPCNLTIHGYMPKNTILEYMYCSDVFVLPTYTDVWGLVIVEALSCGIPVVTTLNCNAGVELINNGSNGYLIPIKSEHEVSRAISKSLKLNKEKVKKYDAELMKYYTVEEAAYMMQKNIYEKE